MNILLAADTGGGYVAAAYLVFIVMLAVYLAIMARKLSKIQNRVSEIQQHVERSDRDNAQADGPIE
jgi:cell division protein FtsL